MEQTQELNLTHYLHLIKKQRYVFAITAAVIMTLAVAISYVIPPEYEAKTIVSIEKNTLNTILKGIGNTGQAQTSDDKIKALSTIMKSRTLVFKVLKDLMPEVGQMNEIEIEKIIKKTQDKTDIDIEFSRASKTDIDFFVVSFRHRSPQMARDYVNSLVSKYIEESLSTKREGSTGANRFLLDQVNLFKEKVSKLDSQIGALKKDPDLVYYDRYMVLQTRLNELLVQYTDSHPEVMKARAELEALKANFRRDHRADGSGKKELSISSIAPMKNRLAELEAEQGTNKKIYEELIAAYGKSEMTSQADMQNQAGSFRIVDPAVLPVKPASPNRLKIMLLGILGGIAGSFGLLVGVDSLKHAVKHVDEVRGFGVPVVAIIPHIENASEIIKARKRDRYLYGLSGLFVVLLIAVIARELLQ